MPREVALDLRWLHVSDLHVGAGDTYEQDVVLGAFLRSIREEGLLEGRPIDLVLCTGDVAQFGKPEEYRNAARFFEQLEKALELPPERVFVVPGNHDLDREMVDIAPKLESREEANKFFGYAPRVESAWGLFHGFRDFHREHFGHAPSGERPYSAHRVDVRGLSVGILGFNDAWRATQDRKKGELVLGERVVRKALEEFDPDRGRTDILVALMHYPLAWLDQFDEDPVTGLLMERCDFILEGHLHAAKPREVSSPDGHAAILGAGALYQTCEWPNLAYVVELRGAEARVEALSFKNQGRGRWIFDPTIFNKSGGAFTVRLARGSDVDAGRVAAPSTEISTAYLRRVARETRCVELPGISPGDEKARLVARIPLHEIYVPLRTRATAVIGQKSSKRKRGLEEESAAFAEEHAVDLVDHARAHPFLAVVGEPGSGKSTFLQFLGHQLASAALGEAEARRRPRVGPDAALPIPVFVSLKKLASHLPAGEEPTASSLLDALCAWAEKELHDLTPAQLRAAFGARRLALLLDGLDEIPDTPSRERVAAAVAYAGHALADKHGPGFAVLTSRPRAYAGDARLPEPFAECRILDLSREDVERYLSSWVRVLHELPPGADPRQDPAAARELDGLLRAVRANVHLRQQTRTPILLTTLALVYHVRGQLPEQRAVLYDEAVDVLLRRFKEHERWKRPELREHLGAVAARMMRAATPEELREEEEREEVLLTIARRIAKLPADAPPESVPRDACKDAEKLLSDQELHAGLLRAPTERSSRFVHRTFQEFLAAWYLADQLEEAEVHRLFTDHLREPSWQECLRLIGGVWAKDGSGKVGRLLAHLAGDPKAPIVKRAPGIAAAMALLADLEQFGLPDAILDPIRAEKAGLLSLLEDPSTPRDTRIGLAEALGRVGDPRLGWDDDVHVLLVPAGEYFRGGWDAEALPDEKPADKVYVSTFRIAAFPVTCGQFLEFVEDPEYDDEQLWPDEPPARDDLEERVQRWRKSLNHPVTAVSWFEARAFCLWLQREQPRADGLVWCLPTEAEWEKAARGGLELTPGVPNPGPKRVYPWIGPWDEANANSSVGDSVGSTTPVGCYSAGRGPYGAWDQAGNVWEWCADWFAERYEREAARDPQGPASGDRRVLRGGSWWLDAPQYLRVAYRDRFVPSGRLVGVGFRVVAAPPRA